MSKLSEGSVLTNIISGGISGGLARFFVAPLDVVKIRFQLQVNPKIQTMNKPDYFYNSIFDAFTTIYKNEGVKGLWKGNVIAEIMWVAHMGLQFGFYSFFNKNLKGVSILNHEKIKPFVSLISGAASGIATALGAYPLDLLRTRLAALGHTSEVKPRPAITLVSSIYRTNGIKGFYYGVCPSIWQIVPYCGVQFFVYENMSRILSKYNFIDTKISPTICGGVAGLSAKLSSFPLDTIKKKIQGHGLFQNQLSQNSVSLGCPKLLPTIKSIYQLEGTRGFYKGLVPSMLKSAIQAALIFTFYEYSKSILTLR